MSITPHEMLHRNTTRTTMTAINPTRAASAAEKPTRRFLQRS
jgi:hypothetical protein